MFLNCHSQHSFHYGLLKVEELVSLAIEHGIRSLALTDINSTAAAIEFVLRCREAGIQPVIGIEFRLSDRLKYIGLARNRNGFTRLNRFLNEHLVNGQTLPACAPDLPDTFFIYDLKGAPSRPLRKNEFIGIRPGDIHHVHRHARHFPPQLVSLIPITIRDRSQWQIHKILRCIHLNTIWTEVPDDLCCQPEECFLSPAAWAQAYASHPYLIKNSNSLLDTCSFDLDDSVDPNLSTFLGHAYADFQLLTHLATRGLHHRYGPSYVSHLARLEQELSIIRRLNLTHYFLITWDIVQFARRRGYRHVGRGSGANSLVAYALFITDVDPISLNLYFERFINVYRPAPPDFDLDFSWDERDEILRYLQQRYGADQVGLLATYQTFRGKSVVREMGKVLGLTRKEIDLIIRYPLEKEKHHPLAARIFRLGRDLLELPSHFSIHSGGVVISSLPLANLTASQMMPKGFPITQCDMHHAEQWGLHKYDLLSQRGTRHIKETVELVKQTRGEKIDISNMDLVCQDRKALDLLRTPGGCIGCFYIESPAMRGLLVKVPCRNYRDLIAVSSIIRPGVAKSGMMDKYIERFHDPSKMTHLLPELGQLLEETFGIMVYQEDVMKVVHHLGKFDLYESDLLRRLMTGKKKSKRDLVKLQERFIENAEHSGIPGSIVRELWRQISSFSGYSFCKAHSATYAAESMQSLYLKAHYPVEFMVAVINNDGGFYPREVYVRELIRLGAEVELPCIQQSSWLTRIHRGKVYLGLKLVKGITRQTGEAIVTLRKEHWPLSPLPHLIDHIDPSQLDLLIEIGALRSLDTNHFRLLFERRLYSYHNNDAQLKLFHSGRFDYQPDKIFDKKRQALSQMRLLDFTLESPYLLFDIPGRGRRRCTAFESGQRVEIIGYYVMTKPVTTERGDHMCFVTWYDLQLDFFDTVHFAPALKQYPLQGKGIYLIEGLVESDHNYSQIIVSRSRPIQLLDDLQSSENILSDYQYLSFTKD